MNQEIVIHQMLKTKKFNLYYIHIDDQTQTNKQRDSEKFATPSPLLQLNTNSSIQLKHADYIVDWMALISITSRFEISLEIQCTTIFTAMQYLDRVKGKVCKYANIPNPCRSGQHGMSSLYQCVLNLLSQKYECNASSTSTRYVFMLMALCVTPGFCPRLCPRANKNLHIPSSYAQGTLLHNICPQGAKLRAASSNIHFLYLPYQHCTYLCTLLTCTLPVLYLPALYLPLHSTCTLLTSTLITSTVLTSALYLYSTYQYSTYQYSTYLCTLLTSTLLTSTLLTNTTYQHCTYQHSTYQHCTYLCTYQHCTYLCTSQYSTYLCTLLTGTLPLHTFPLHSTYQHSTYGHLTYLCTILTCILLTSILFVPSHNLPALYVSLAVHT
ncbi:hypothetical protein T08_7296 [Trichinella sp. T8]|nr:hypothetical protein T08_7296 [Trichinella sp. T8]